MEAINAKTAPRVLFRYRRRHSMKKIIWKAGCPAWFVGFIVLLIEI